MAIAYEAGITLTAVAKHTTGTPHEAFAARGVGKNNSGRMILVDERYSSLPQY